MTRGAEFAEAITKVIEFLNQARDSAIKDDPWQTAFYTGGAHGVLLREWSKYASQYE